MDKLRAAAAWIPRGVQISDEEFERRHRTLRLLLALQVPALFAFGVFRGYGLVHLALEVAPAIAALLAASSHRLPRRLRSAGVTAGLVWISASLVHLSGGYIEAHFHFFAMLGFIALYQDWIPFGWAVVFTATSHAYMTFVDPDSMFNHEAAQQQPLLWSAIHAGAVLFACVGQLVSWKAAEREAEEKARARAAEQAERSARAAEAERQDAIAQMYVDLSRRNGTLVERQLDLIDALEAEVEDADTLGRVFELDHLTTRIRRNADSLLVVAGADQVRGRRASARLVDVVRAAVSEIDQYQRVEVDVAVDLAEVEGRVVHDVVHLLAELVDNGTAYSPPTTRVRVDARPAADGGVVLTVEDRGIGMEPAALSEANGRLRSPAELTVATTRHLGHNVVARLAAKHGMDVRLRPTEGGGVTAVVALPGGLLVREAPQPVRQPAAPSAPAAVAAPAALPVGVASAHDPTPPAVPAPTPPPPPPATHRVPSSAPAAPLSAPAAPPPAPAGPVGPVIEGATTPNGLPMRSAGSTATGGPTRSGLLGAVDAPGAGEQRAQAMHALSAYQQAQRAALRGADRKDLR